MTPSLDTGLLWVQARIRELATELGRPVDRLEWPRPCPSAGPVPLKIWRGGADRIRIRATAAMVCGWCRTPRLAEIGRE